MNMTATVEAEDLQRTNYCNAALSDHASVLTDIYEEDINIAIWQRSLSNDLYSCVDKLLESHRNYSLTSIAEPETIFNKLIDSENELANAKPLCKNISELVEMFCMLFDLKQVGLRLTTLDRAMCPRFHVDWVPCRLVCTYNGVASEWLPHDKVDRSKLGDGNNGLADDESGIFKSRKDIKQLKTGDVALLKGERWAGNEGAGLVHRSPQVPAGTNRLLLTLDFLS